MPTFDRSAQVTWNGDLLHGSGVVTAASSLVFQDLPVSWPARTTTQHDTTTPEELIAAAHASCFAMALSGVLAKHDHVARALDITATVKFGNVDGKWTVVASHLDVTGTVPGMDEPAFARITQEAADECPVSRALRGNVVITVDSMLSAEQLAASAGP